MGLVSFLRFSSSPSYDSSLGIFAIQGLIRDVLRNISGLELFAIPYSCIKELLNYLRYADCRNVMSFILSADKVCLHPKCYPSIIALDCSHGAN